MIEFGRVIEFDHRLGLGGSGIADFTRGGVTLFLLVLNIIICCSLVVDYFPFC